MRLGRAVGSAGLVMTGMLMIGEPVEGAVEDWRFGVDMGVLSKTIDRNVFAVGLNADYFLNDYVSVGPMVQLTPPGDLTQINSAGVVRLHLRSRYVNVVPFTGVGLAYAHVSSGRLSARDDSDVSEYHTIGVTVELNTLRSYALAGTIMFNVYRLNLGSTGVEEMSTAFMLGVRFGR